MQNGDEQYNLGFADAINSADAFLKIILIDKTADDVKEIFGYDSATEVLKQLSLNDAMNILKDYLTSHILSIGDSVSTSDGKTGAILSIMGNRANVVLDGAETLEEQVKPYSIECLKKINK